MPCWRILAGWWGQANRSGNIPWQAWWKNRSTAHSTNAAGYTCSQPGSCICSTQSQCQSRSHVDSLCGVMHLVQPWHSATQCSRCIRACMYNYGLYTRTLIAYQCSCFNRCIQIARARMMWHRGHTMPFCDKTCCDVALWFLAASLRA